MVLKQIKLVSVPVSDQDRALEFWTETMGCQVVTDQPMGPGARWIEVKIPGAQTGLALFTTPGQEDRIGTFANISFVTDNVERAHAELSAKGVTFSKPPTKESWGTSAVFEDPDGNRFVLSSR